MNFEWDDQKRLSNIEKHGIDFVVARHIFDGRPRRDLTSPRADEHRVLGVGELNGTMVAVAWTRRGAGTIRIISARRARREEEQKYREVHG
jgi:uncharacterized protein